MARGIDRTIIFLDDADRAKFFEIVEESVGKTGTKVPAWSIMGNHFHLLVLSGPPGLPAFMRKLMTRYGEGLEGKDWGQPLTEDRMRPEDYEMWR